MILPTPGLPVKKMKSHCCANRAVVSGTAPSTTATTRGSKYLGTRLAVAAEQATASSDGFSTAVFPPAKSSHQWREQEHERLLSLYAAFNTKTGEVLGKTAA